MKKVLIAGLAGGLVVFFWGAISWMLLPFHNMTMKQMPNEDAVAEVMRANLTESGVYTYPGTNHAEVVSGAMTEEQAMSKMVEKAKRGPNMPVFVYYPEGIDLWDPKFFLAGFVLCVLSATLLAFTLTATHTSFPTAGAKTLLAFVLAGFVSLTSHLESWNWLMFPSDFTAAAILDELVGWGLAGLLIAKLVTPKHSTNA